MEMLPHFIEAHTAPGRIVHSDEWEAYNRVQGLPTVSSHGVVNHFITFVDPLNLLSSTREGLRKSQGE